MRLIEGAVLDPKDAAIESLEREVERLQKELRRAHEDARDAEQQSGRAVGALRRQLTPLYRALQAVFGEMDTIGGSDEQQQPTQNGTQGHAPRVTAVWESWKSKLPGGPAKIIDALLLHREMNTQQLAIAIGMSRHSIPAFIYKLNKAGLINKNGQRFSLKEL